MTRAANTVFAVTNACAGCGACIKTCPEKAIRPAPRGDGSPLIVLADRCSGCAECAEVCPVSACVEVAPLPESRESGKESRRTSALATHYSLLTTHRRSEAKRSDDR